MMNGTKVWWQSKAVWGSAIAMVAGVVSLAGVQLDASLQDELASLLTGAGEVVGGALALYGRLTAKTVLR
jgi:hypothetical protein